MLMRRRIRALEEERKILAMIKRVEVFNATISKGEPDPSTRDSECKPGADYAVVGVMTEDKEEKHERKDKHGYHSTA